MQVSTNTTWTHEANLLIAVCCSALLYTSIHPRALTLGSLGSSRSRKRKHPHPLSSVASSVDRSRWSISFSTATKDEGKRSNCGDMLWHRGSPSILSCRR
ncbi:hypothetical protein AOQ84DRAFT_38993 [Glonium stellatum]|uniref:Uncharacterized protein n=1 Tax=Glonium stellatum TaxID=574774 RepID=A0A8E2F1G0_9PEZI|nr:hypothetical protein AOQ84DRAFT_38993 [Glonium stellatum]